MSDSPHGSPDVARWHRARAIFDEIVLLDPALRWVRLTEACGGDSRLCAEVASLLAHDRSSNDTIARLVLDAAADAVLLNGPAADAPVPPTIGRYRVIARLGEGGMGEVFLAEDATLGRPVALKVPAALLARDSQVRARLLGEAKAAATLNHPHVCVVHEVGEASDGRPFIAMEYLEGETLAARIARGPLPLDEVVALARGAAGALEAAHEHGVVHRDIKPSNNMMTPHGVKLLDFGLASIAHDARGDMATGVFGGTIPYMSPEQSRGETVDGRTDLFSLGVVLHEAATGHRPFDGATPRAVREAILGRAPLPPSRLVPELPSAFDRVIGRLLAKTRDTRYQHARELAADLDRMAVPRRAPAGWLVAAAALLVAAAAALLPGRVGTGFVPPQPERETVLVGDFSNTTGETAFDGALREALIVQLQQTPFISVFPQAGVRESLRLMARSADEPVTPGIARQIAVRRGIPAWIAGSIGHRGQGYVITLTATSTQNGDVLASARADAAGKRDVLPALGAAILQMRRKLGEPRRSLRTFSTPIEHATTPSLDALKAYALGIEQANRGEYAVAAILFQRAVQIDPDFAIAHQALAREELNSSYSDRVIAAAIRAFELRGRVSEQEQARIVVSYHTTVTGDLDRAIAAAAEWQRVYPSEWWPYHALADLYFSIGAYPKAVEAARKAVQLNPDIAAAYSNLAGALFALDRFEEAREIYRQAMTRGFDAPEYHAFLWRIGYYGGDEDAMRQELDWAASSSTWAYNMPALAAALQGRWRAARQWSAGARALFESRGQSGLAALAARYETLTASLVGDCAVVGRTAASALKSDSPDDHAQVALALALCGERQRALALTEDVRVLRPNDTRISRIWRPAILAAVALDEGDGPGAVRILQAASPYEGAADSWPVYVRALARLRAGAGDEARADFERILAHRGRTFWIPLVPLAHLGRARAAAQSGDAVTAAGAYQELFALWKDADPNLPALVEARREYAALNPRSDQ